MGKGVKAGFSVVRAHAAFSESAEPHSAGGKMDDGVIDASASKAASGGNHGFGRLVVGKEIEGQGMGHGVDLPYCLGKGLIG